MHDSTCAHLCTYLCSLHWPGSAASCRARGYCVKWCAIYTQVKHTAEHRAELQQYASQYRTDIAKLLLKIPRELLLLLKTNDCLRSVDKCLVSGPDRRSVMETACMCVACHVLRQSWRYSLCVKACVLLCTCYIGPYAVELCSCVTPLIVHMPCLTTTRTLSCVVVYNGLMPCRVSQSTTLS